MGATIANAIFEIAQMTQDADRCPSLPRSHDQSKLLLVESSTQQRLDKQFIANGSLINEYNGACACRAIDCSQQRQQQTNMQTTRYLLTAVSVSKPRDDLAWIRQPHPYHRHRHRHRHGHRRYFYVVCYFNGRMLRLRRSDLGSTPGRTRCGSQSSSFSLIWTSLLTATIANAIFEIAQMTQDADRCPSLPRSHDPTIPRSI